MEYASVLQSMRFVKIWTFMLCHGIPGTWVHRGGHDEHRESCQLCLISSLILNPGLPGPHCLHTGGVLQQTLVWPRATNVQWKGSAQRPSRELKFSHSLKMQQKCSYSKLCGCPNLRNLMRLAWQCSARGVRKVTTGITGLWQPSVHSDVAFWSFDVGSSYHCVAEVTKCRIVPPLTGNVSWV